MTLQFSLTNQQLSLSPRQKNIKVVADSKNYLKASFALQSSEWTSAVLIWALFSHNGKTYKKLLGSEEGLAQNECYVSPEVIKEGKFSVSIYCDNIITTNKVDIPVEASGYTTKIENQKSTPDVMEQMNNKMYRYAKLCNDILKECQKIKEEGDK